MYRVCNYLYSANKKKYKKKKKKKICCGHNWLSENKLSVLSNSPKGHVLLSDWLIHLFHLRKQDVNSNNVKKYKHKIRFDDTQSCRVAGHKLYFLKKYLFQVLPI